mmetsp:Transcript_30145/g.90337  ORF Transcript_30145/g.90337 Transcript_30145/m.90337 type:complete len:341 (-) Transcript_30145:231-1253(-)
MSSPQKLRERKRGLVTELARVEAAWNEVVSRDRSAAIAALQTRASDLRARVSEANDAAEEAVELDDELIMMKEELEMAADRKSHAENQLRQKRADLAAARAQLEGTVDVAPPCGASGGAIGGDGGRAPIVTVEEAVAISKLRRQKEAMERVRVTQDAEVGELGGRIAALRVTVAELRQLLEDVVASVPQVQAPFSDDLIVATAVDTAGVSRLDGHDLERLVQVLKLHRHIKEATFNNTKQAETVHALRAELNRAKLEAVANSPRDRGAATARLQPFGAPSATSPTAGSRGYSSAPRRRSTSGSPLDRGRGETISWKPPPKPPKPSPGGSVATRHRFGTMA